jgi:hypothetical protein
MTKDQAKDHGCLAPVFHGPRECDWHYADLEIAENRKLPATAEQWRQENPRWPSHERAKASMKRIMTGAINAMWDDEDIVASLRNHADRDYQVLVLIRAYVEDLQDERTKWRMSLHDAHDEDAELPF